jgi:sulfite exporter TauE/SafE
MCGGLVLSQTIKREDGEEQNGKKLRGKIKLDQTEAVEAEQPSKLETLKPSFLYNAGRVISYTVVGGIVGALGSVFNMSLTMQGWIQIIGGVFMVIMGLNLLNVFPWLRKLNPRMPKFLAFKIRKSKRGKGPFYVGLANGLMPCGPLQAMQLFALATGSPIQGALSMLVFSLGTVPLMFLVGALSSILSKKFAGKIMAVGAVLVMVMGLTMFNRGLSLSGINLFAGDSGNAVRAEVVGDVQVVQTTLYRWDYEPIVVAAGIPVEWTIYVPDGNLTGCNNPIVIPEWDIEVSLEVGENLIEFTPTQTGTFQYMCWMGMIRSDIFVTN